MVRLALACVLASFLLSGCMADPADPPGAPTTTGRPTPSETPTASAPPPTGSAGPQANATPPQPRTTRFDGTWTAGVHSPGISQVGVDGTMPYTLELKGSEAGIVVEMAWVPSTPASAWMAIEVSMAGSGLTPAIAGTAAGTGPLRLALPGLSAGNYTVNARASGPEDKAGAFVLQDYTLWVTVFAGLPFDEAYVAPK
ncbi:MAG TPA: hypothetical protein VHI93_01050 [Candidatus Thermoplasmatota archaeon]|nr:hypothetical protein [Candidatus Thermoplasmatota archaeon]